MNKKRTHRWIAAFLCLALVMTMPSMAIAEEEKTKTASEETAGREKTERSGAETAKKTAEEKDKAASESQEKAAPADQEKDSAAEPAKAAEQTESKAGEPEGTVVPSEPAPKTEESGSKESSEPAAEAPAISAPDEAAKEPKPADEESTEAAETKEISSDSGKTPDQKDTKAEAKEAGKTEKDSKPASGSSAEKKVQIRSAKAGAVDDSTDLPDGEYTNFDFKWTLSDGSTSKANLVLEKVVVSGGKATGYFTASSANMTHVYYLGHTGSGDAEDPAYYDPDTDTCADGVLPIKAQAVSFPVSIGKETPVACRTTAMSTPHWIQYLYTITPVETPKEQFAISFKAVDKKSGKAIAKAAFTVKDEGGKKVTAESDGSYLLENAKYTVTASAENYEDGVLKNYTPTAAETVTIELEPKETIPAGTIVFTEDAKNLFNTTAMFKVVKGTLVSSKTKTTLTISLSGSGYHYLFKGTYEAGLKNGLNKKNWIAGSVNSAGKWEFVIPLKESETFIPIVAVSDSHLKKVEKGEEELGDAIFARQLVLDLKKKTLTAGDYDATEDIKVVSKTGKFKVNSKGTMEVTGGPNSNNYACRPIITMLDRLFNKAFIGTADNAAKKDAKTIALKNGKFKFEFINSFGAGGKIIMFEDKKPIAIAFFDTKENKWVNYKMTIDKSASTVTIEALDKDEEPPAEPQKPEPQYQDDSDQGTQAVDSKTTLDDGVYTPKSFSFSGGSGRIIIVLDKLEVKNGQAYATITFKKKNGGAASMDSLRANGQTYSGFNTFTIPVELNANNKVVGRTTAMSVPHWIEYTIFIAMDEPGKEKEDKQDVSENKTEMDEEAPEILGLEAKDETEIVYSDLIRIFNYEDGYYLIEIDAVQDTARDTLENRTQIELDALAKAKEKKESEENAEEPAEEEALEEGGSSSAEESISDMIAQLYKNEIIKYLVIPVGKEVPAGLDKEVIIISQPLDKAYIASEEALEMISAIGAQKNITAVGLEKEDVKNEEILKRMEKEAGEDGAILYAGPFDDWDLRSFITGKMNFAVQSSLILPRDEKTLEEDMENLVRLGQRSAQLELAMFIDRSEDETNALATAEWYKAYGVLFGCADQAEALYKDVVNAASDKDKQEAEELLKTRAEAKSKLKAEAQKAAEEQAKED